MGRYRSPRLADYGIDHRLIRLEPTPKMQAIAAQLEALRLQHQAQLEALRLQHQAELAPLQAEYSRLEEREQRRLFRDCIEWIRLRAWP